MEIKRDAYLQQLIERKDNGMIKVITGIRRCGKSFLLFTLMFICTSGYLCIILVKLLKVVLVLARIDNIIKEVRGPSPVLQYSFRII